MKLSILKGRATDRPANTRRLTENILVKAVEGLAKELSMDEEKVFADLMDLAGAETEESKAIEEIEKSATLEDLLEGSVQIAIKAISDSIGMLNKADLQTLIELENEGGKGRKGITEFLEGVIADL